MISKLISSLLGFKPSSKKATGPAKTTVGKKADILNQNEKVEPEDVC